MNAKIAVLLDATNRIGNIYTARYISLYSLVNRKWKAVDRINIAEVVFSSVDQPQLYAKEMLSQFDKVDVVVATEFTELYHDEILNLGIAIATAKNFGKGLLKYVNQQFAKGNKEIEIDETFKVPVTPTPLDNQGHYFVDLISVQDEYPRLTAKEILIPFFSKDGFSTLNILCEKALPWLDAFLSTRHLEGYVDQVNGKTVVTVTRKLCGDN